MRFGCWTTSWKVTPSAEPAGSGGERRRLGLDPGPQAGGTRAPRGSTVDGLGEPIWSGQPGRVEVWYATFTDRETGTGYWLHYETVSPSSVRPDPSPFVHGWVAAFPNDGEPRFERFGPETLTPGRGGDRWVGTGDTVAGPGLLRGKAGALSWDVTFEDGSEPIFTFGRAVWERRLLPGAQCAPWPAAVFRGRVAIDGSEREVEGRGAVARIYGHSNAQRWCWLHADLGDGAALELVAATARRASLRRLPPLAMLQLRLPGEPDRPRWPVLAAPLLRTRIGGSGFEVSGPIGRRRIEIEVTIPDGRSVALTYTDPDGSTATCTNSEVADAVVRLRHREDVRTWELRGRAHAEIGRRP